MLLLDAIEADLVCFLVLDGKATTVSGTGTFGIGLIVFLALGVGVWGLDARGGDDGGKTRGFSLPPGENRGLAFFCLALLALGVAVGEDRSMTSLVGRLIVINRGLTSFSSFTLGD